MRNNPSPFVFISYRRQDSSVAARWLGETIQNVFGETSVFIDVDSIRISDEWQLQLSEGLGKATTMIAVIGNNWLRIADEYGRRRIDKEDDWVRRELIYGIENKLNIIPLLVSGAILPEPQGLPSELSRLAHYQAFELRDSRWQSDLKTLLSRLEELGFKRKKVPVFYPLPHSNPNQLDGQDLLDAMSQLPEWQLATSPIPGLEPNQRTELMRSYEFKTFDDVIQFMSDAAGYINQINHHPRWENIYRGLSVWLTSWDIGHKPSRLDIDLANYLDILYEQYKPTKTD